MKTKQEILNLLAPLLQEYIDNPETCGYNNDGGCVYTGTNKSGDNVKCIFGSCLTEDGLSKVAGSTRHAGSVLSDHSEGILKNKYKGISSSVWIAAQQVHDSIARGRGDEMHYIKGFRASINNSLHPGERISELGLKLPETA